MGNETKEEMIPYYKRIPKKAILYFAGTSGSGKTYMAKKLQELYPQWFKKPIQNTTRPPREGEVDGVDYNFIDKDTFSLADLNENFVSKTEIGDVLYGTSIQDFDPDKINIVVVNSKGYLNGLGVYDFKKHSPDGYQTILIGFEYTYNINDPLRSRGVRDQLEDYNYFKKFCSNSFDAIIKNESDNFVSPEQVLNTIKQICYEKGYYNILYRNKW